MSKIKIGVLISGGGTNLQAIIDNTKNGHINGEVVCVISNRSDAFGLERAKKENIEGFYVEKSESSEIYNKKVVKILKSKNVDLVVLAGYLKILSKNFTDAYKNRIINIHPSLIPSFCGKGCYGEKVHEKVLEYGVKITGATTHFVDENTDTGPIIIQRCVEVKYDDTVESLQKRVLKTEHEILVETVRLFCEGKISVSGRKVKLGGEND